MNFTPYEWQNRLLKIYKDSGVIKAFAGTGKTYATILLVKNRGYKNILIAVPTRKLKSQWAEELKKYELEGKHKAPLFKQIITESRKSDKCVSCGREVGKIELDKPTSLRENGKKLTN